MIRSFSILLLTCLSVPSALSPQRGGRPAGGVIDVQVRYSDGSQGPRGIHIRLEAAEGGPAGDCVTIEGGKCQFTVASGGVYIVRMIELGFKEVNVRVELIGMSRGYAYLELRPAPGAAPQVAPATSPSALSVHDLLVPENARLEFSKGESALGAHKPAEAEKHFQKAIKSFESYPQAYLLLGQSYLAQQNWEKAESAFKRSIELDPTVVASYADLGAIYNQQKDYIRAEQALKKGLELDPEAGLAKYELAKTYLSLGRWEEAEPLVRQTLMDAPNLAPAHVLMGNIFLKRRDPASALHEFQQYLQLEPNGVMAQQVNEIIAKLNKIKPN